MVTAPRILLLVWLGVLAASPTLAQNVLTDAEASLETVIEESPATPLAGEMVLVTVRGSYSPRIDITLHTLSQPDLDGLSWMQLARDAWANRPVDGQPRLVFERRLAIFPQRAGRVEIGAFTHRLTLATGDGGRVVQDVRSPPAVLDVSPQPGPAEWWLPARELRVTDAWDRRPDRLGSGDIARRTVTLEAVGLPAQFLPPMPKLSSSGVMVFADPEERSTKLTRDGPVGQVTWRWTARPASSAPARIEALSIPWFDTAARQAREIVLEPQNVAFADAVNTRFGPASAMQRIASLSAPIGVVLGLVAGLAAMLSGARLKSRPEIARILRRWRPDPDHAAFRRASRRKDPVALRHAARRILARSERERGPAPPDVHAFFADLDRSLYGPEAERAGYDFRKARRSFIAALRAWRTRVRRGVADASRLDSPPRRI